MSLLLDALNRASKEKQKVAAAAAQVQAPAAVPASAPQSVAQPVPEAPTLNFFSPPAQDLKWEEISHSTPTSAHQSSEMPMRPEPPVLMTPVVQESELELTLVDAPHDVSAPVSTAPFEPAVRPDPTHIPEVLPLTPMATELVREPVLESHAEPALQTVPAPLAEPVFTPSTPREPTFEAPATPSQPSAPVSPPPPPPPPPPAAQEAAPALVLAPATSSKSVPDDQKAQDIRRAYEGPSSDARKGRRRVMALGGLAVGLALAFGSVFLGLWGDPAKWLGGTSLSSVAPPPAVAVEEPSVPVEPAAPDEQPSPGAVPTDTAPVAIAAASSSVASTTPAAPDAKPVSGPKTTTSGRAAPASHATTGDVAASIANSSVTPVPTGNEVVLSGNSRANPSFVAKTRGPSALEHGYALLLEGRLDDAAVAYGQALRANADERDALLGMAYISQQKGQRDDAQTYYRRVLRQEPNNARALAAMQALDSGSDPTLTASRTGDLAARQPDSAAAMAMAGNAFVRDGLISSAAQAYARAQALEPNNPLHAYNHAVALDRLGRFALAIVQYERVLNLSATAPVAERAYRIEDVRLRLAQLHQALAETESVAP